MAFYKAVRYLLNEQFNIALHHLIGLDRGVKKNVDLSTHPPYVDKKLKDMGTLIHLCNCARKEHARIRFYTSKKIRAQKI